MDYTVLERSTLFNGVSTKELRDVLEGTPHHIQCYDKEEIIFHMIDVADRVGIILEGRAQAQKSFPNGSQINVSVRSPGELIGPAAVFSKSRRYPCDVVALEPVTVMVFRREDLLALLQKNTLILENLMTEIASATYMLQQRLELMSYNGIAQKAAFWMLMQARRSGKDAVKLPGSVSKWAMLMNVSRPSLHRELKKLEEEGIISYSHPMIRILNLNALQDVLGRS